MYCSLSLLYIMIPPANEVWGGGGGYIGITPSVCLSVRLSRVNLTLIITFQPIEIRLSYYSCWLLVTRPFFPYQKNWPCDLNLDFWKNLTLALIFESKEIGQKSRSRGKKFCFQQKGLATRNTYLLYESLISLGSKIIAKVKFFQK